jgi:hypothetical protein
MQIYKTVIRPVTTYGSETWTLTKSEKNSLRIFERKILKIYGPVQQRDTWRIRYNEQLSGFIKGEDIVTFIKAQRIRWMGHVKRMEAGAMPRKMMEGRLFTGRRKGRPRLRWINDVLADLSGMIIHGTRRRQRIGSSGDWLSRRPRLTQGCIAEWMDGIATEIYICTLPSTT